MAKIDTTRFDAADYLASAEDAAAYLDAYLEDGTLDELRAALGTVARSRGMTDLADKTGITRAGLYKALGDEGNPSLATIQSILKAMDLRLAIEPVERELEAA